MSETVFSKIIKGLIPARIVWQNDEFIAFLDINPIVKGHTLLVPKKVIVDKFYDLDDETYSKLFNTAKHLARKMEEIMGCSRVGIMIEGFGVPHVHIHLLPLESGGTIIKNDHLKLNEEEWQTIEKKLKEGLSEINI